MHATRKMPSRSELRQLFKNHRAALTPAQRAAASERIAQHLEAYIQSHSSAGKAATVAAFAATPTEVDLRIWIDAYLARGGQIALPRVGDRRSMEFYAYTAATEVEANKFGIIEPVSSSVHLSARAIDVVLVPLVAFDDAGHRLGMGGGYYDRYLPRLRADVPLLGVAFACQRYETLLPRESWDVPLHGVVTEQGLLDFNSQLT